MGVGEAFIKAAHEAIRRDVPYVIFTAAGGARMQEGALALMQMARATLALNEVKAAGLPYVVVLTDPTTGGVSASYAMLGDIHLAEPNAMVAFAGRRVIEQTIRETLPPGFQRAEFLVERGQIDRVVQRSEIPAVLGSVLKTLMIGRARSKAASGLSKHRSSRPSPGSRFIHRLGCFQPIDPALRYGLRPSPG
jgi:acetyl-CoA carboxylase carboxyl transferase subunit beta